MPGLTHIFRHPIKAVGLESLAETQLQTGKTVQGDRIWAVMHDASKYDPAEGWGRCMNFMRGVSSHQLMAVRATLADDTVTLTHPDRPSITLNPDHAADAAKLIEWIEPIRNTDRAAPSRVVRATRQGMTDNSSPYISILSGASLDDLSTKCGKPLARERFRGNLWIDGTPPWQEFDWMGQCLRIGDAVLEVRERITRCRATTVDPITGQSDVETLQVLDDNWGHRDFGLLALVTNGGTIRVGDKVDLL